MKIYLISDTHFWHNQLKERWRPKNFEEKIKKNLLLLKDIDILIHLGDVCIWNDKEHNNWFGNLSCKKILVRWNHDWKSDNWYYNNWRDFVCRRFDIKRFNKKIAFTHIPIEKETSFDINIHWHLHDMDKRRHASNLYTFKHTQLISMEYLDYKPVELWKLFSNKDLNKQCF